MVAQVVEETATHARTRSEREWEATCGAAECGKVAGRSGTNDPWETP